MRKTKDVVISAEGRDKGKAFLITEMSARQAERWATRALLALVRSGADIPDGVQDMGLAGVALVGVKAFSGVRYEDAEPLLDEMMACVQIKEKLATRPLLEDDVEEVATYLLLREEVLAVHLGFSLREKLSPLISAANRPPASSDTSTSRKTSARSSRRA